MAWESRISFPHGDARTVTTEAEPRYPTDPPRFRKAPKARPEDLLSGRCETCTSFLNVGFCVKYQTPVEDDNLCDGYVPILEDGKRQWAEP
jgi:hypothetical protein